MDYKGHKLYLQNKDGKFEEFTYEMAIETMIGQSQGLDELQNRINKAKEIYENRNSIKYKKKRFMEGKNTSDLMYEVLKEEKNETNNNN